MATFGQFQIANGSENIRRLPTKEPYLVERKVMNQ